MTWTYNPATIETVTKDQVRRLIGDTVVSEQQFQDEEIAFFLSQRGSIYGASALACRALATQYSRSVDSSAGDTKRAFSQRAKSYKSMAAQFEIQSAARGGGSLPYAGGISIADKQRQDQDDDRVEPGFNVGMQDDLIPVGPVGQENSELSPSTMNQL